MEIKMIKVSNYCISQCSWGKKASQHMQQKGGKLSFFSFTVQDMSSVKWRVWDSYVWQTQQWFSIVRVCTLMTCKEMMCIVCVPASACMCVLQRDVAEQVRDRLPIMSSSDGFSQDHRNVDHLERERKIKQSECSE